MEKHLRSNEPLAFWLAPLASTIPLIPFFSLPSSPLFLGKLMGDPAHPFLWPHLGPWLAAMAVVFNGMLLAYFTALPVYLVLKATGTMPAIRTLVLFSLAGVLASQLVHVTQHFRQPGLREFAVSWLWRFSDAFVAWFPVGALRSSQIVDSRLPREFSLTHCRPRSWWLAAVLWSGLRRCRKSTRIAISSWPERTSLSYAYGSTRNSAQPWAGSSTRRVVALGTFR